MIVGGKKNVDKPEGSIQKHRQHWAHEKQVENKQNRKEQHRKLKRCCSYILSSPVNVLLVIEGRKILHIKEKNPLSFEIWVFVNIPDKLSKTKQKIWKRTYEIYQQTRKWFKDVKENIYYNKTKPPIHRCIEYSFLCVLLHWNA